MKQQLEKAAVIRRKLNDELWPQMNATARAWERQFGKHEKDDEAKKHFIHLKNMVHYKGGWPSATTPPRLETLVKEFAWAVRYLRFLGGDEKQRLEEYLECEGLTVSDSNEMKDAPIGPINMKVHRDLREAKIEHGDLGRTKREALATLVDSADKLQGVICSLSDKIKIDIAKEVEVENGIRKKDFVDAVSLTYRTKKAESMKNGIRRTKSLKNVSKGADVMERDAVSRSAAAAAARPEPHI